MAPSPTLATPKKTMRQWLNVATAKQKQQVAELAGTSVPHLQHIAGGRRKVSAELAMTLAHASKTLSIKKLLLDPRTLCDACSVCPLVDKRKAPIGKADAA
jgi:hypothetical protein